MYTNITGTITVKILQWVDLVLEVKLINVSIEFLYRSRQAKNFQQYLTHIIKRKSIDHQRICELLELTNEMLNLHFKSSLKIIFFSDKIMFPFNYAQRYLM